MGRRTPHRRLTPARLALFLGFVLAACSPVAPSAPPVAVVTRLDTALRTRDRDDFLAAFAPTQAQEAASWFAVLDAGGATISAAGPDSLRVSSRLAGDRSQAVEEVGYTLASGLISEVRAVGPNRPVWTLPGVTTATTDGGTLVSAGLAPAQQDRWARRLDAAAARVRAAGVGNGWDGGLVVVVPPEGRFQLVTGTPATEASAITNCAAGTPRIVVNPAVLGQAEWLDSTLVHEAVHVATNSACATGSLGWVVEGLAESVAARADAATGSRNRELVRAYVRTHGVPDALPGTLESLTDYALAALAVEAVRDHLDAEAPAFLQRAISDADSVTAAELRRATAWFREDLRLLAR